ncbi:hypothetical protein BC941DRAFT_503791 [Chlamydoabsidia padenii]|nr:hypothetical protein BC941DRAFT_503791 [Chlamydoabsidia padenii]
MSWQYTDGYNGTYNMTLPKSTSSLVSLPLLDKDNPIQLAALSNYKLAQLTFLTPDCDSLRKTALIKNTNEAIYMDTPTEWLNRMRRWQFFTPESLTNMTQEGLELVFAQYIQIIEAFKPASVNVEEEENGDDDGDDEVWPKDEIPTPDRNISTNSTTVPLVMEYSLYAQAGASMDLLHGKEFKPLPDRPITFSRTVGGGVTTGVAMAQDRRKSIASLRNRLSWTSDTGLLPNSLIGHAWANELMAMFDMEFQVDTNLTLNTAPTLPELPFSSRHKRQSQRYSTDSFMNLIPTFETFKLQESERRITSVFFEAPITQHIPSTSGKQHPEWFSLSIHHFNIIQ